MIMGCQKVRKSRVGRGGGHSNVTPGIICPLVDIGLTDLPKTAPAPLPTTLPVSLKGFPIPAPLNCLFLQLLMAGSNLGNTEKLNINNKVIGIVSRYKSVH